MYSIKNFSHKSYKFFANVTTNPHITEKTIIDNINNLSDIVCEQIISIYSLTVTMSEDIEEIKLSEHDPVKHFPKFYIINEDVSIETNEYALIICLEGSACIEYNINNIYHVKLLTNKDAIIMSLNIKHNINTIKNNYFKLAIFRYKSNKPIIYYKNIVFSEDSIIYTKFNGYYFAISKLCDKDNNTIIDILIVNGKLFSLPSFKYLKYANFKTFLKTYDINISSDYIDDIPKNNKIYDVLNLLITEEITNYIFKYISRQYLISIDNNIYNLIIGYCVACIK
ncbi:Concanavalin-like precursor [Eptesipox virus]|uniref:Concanavalin-like n=1 Tax=Eptesipox virus TaxID=1329402 RepID=A0A220T6I7_9POXV|nr:Concanavalin-like precursor [Eptesipox virus]ASK51334.1 Concanavalin-like precursor [Eptesipox virus]WAH71092.1 concanavalin-like precursor [Eptesipox virus]